MDINILRSELSKHGIKLIDPKLNFRSTPAALNLAKVEMIINHHMASATADVNDVHRWHLQRGWAGIGYNFWISYSGDIYIGRGFRLGAHAAPYNNVSIGIGFQGDFTKSNSMTDAQVKAGGILNSILVKALKLKQTDVMGHKDVVATACPGGYFRWQELRKVVADYLNQKYIEVEGDENKVSTRTMRQGMRGEDVKQLQQFLKTRGYYKGAIDGIYGPQTVEAVKAFQRAEKLQVDGIAGPQTQKRINEILLKGQADNTNYKAKLAEAKNLAKKIMDL